MPKSPEKPKRGRYMTTTGGLVRKVCYLPPDLEDDLRDLAHARRRSESDLIREALVDYFRRLREE